MSPKEKTSKTAGASARDYRIKDGGPWSSAWKAAFGVGAVGLAGAAAGYATDPKRFAFSYLFAFFCFLTPALGALFFVFVQYLSAASWSVTVRRTAEFLMFGLLALVVLAVPVLVSVKTLYPWTAQAGDHEGGHGKEHSSLSMVSTAYAQEKAHGADLTRATTGGHPSHGGTGAEASELSDRPAVEHAEHALHAEVLKGKGAYLNLGFFYARAIAYLVAWVLLARAFFKLSTDQDRSKSIENTVRAQRIAPVAAFLFGITLTFSGIDWVMGLDPMWFSTMFGVHIFAGAVVSMFALLILFTWGLSKAGLLGNAVTTEHFHDMGKLLFGFNCFWSYIVFAEFFLIWYSNIPEETTFFSRRWSAFDHSWSGVSLALAVLHFALPFVLLMSRNVKRKPDVLAALAAALLSIHFLEYYWLVLPNFGALALSWIDIACFLGVGGIYLGTVLRAMTQHPLIPLADPRLERSLHFENA